MTTERTTRRRWRTRGVVGIALSGVTLLSVVTPADASSHREAPLTMQDPVADNTDVYAFVAPDKPDFVTLISNYQGFQEPGGGPNYFRFGDDVLHKIHIDNDGDAVADVTYEFTFETTTVNPDTFLYATGPITSLDDETWNRPQTYSIQRVANGRRTTVASGLRTPPANIGPRSTPDYDALAEEAVHDLDGGGRVFAGQRADGFYADIASVFDLGGLRPYNQLHAAPLPREDGTNTFAGYNVQSIALQVPKSDLVSDGDPVIGVWATASRRATRVFRNQNGSTPVNRGRWVQVSRLGNPLINEVVIPLGLKDAFNSLEPVQDADVLSQPADERGVTIPLVEDPELARLITQLYGVDVPPAPRSDLVSIYLTGIEGLNKPAGDVRPAEMLRLNTSVTPTPFEDQDKDGLLSGQEDGFPNGRRVVDDVLTTSLQAVAGATPLTPEFNKAPNNRLSDGVDPDDARVFLDRFPYLGVPYQGYELNNPARVVSQP